ncbi:hypothetical protein [Streptomyces sp. NPDC048411]|uniref:hypothetical protein n=1 Tax=Streptomyces sp. NPDC048411 TaxID=3157206 RepID=UPI0034541AA1
MFNKWRRFRLAAMALIAACAVVLGMTAPASAGIQGFPGEEGQYHPVTYSGGQIHSRSVEGEARDDRGNILHVWRGGDNDNIWISLSNGPAYPLPATAGSPDHAQTWAAPTVIWTDDGYRGNFRIFHTGTDGHIYQHRIQLTTAYQLPATLPYATQIPNNARTNTPQPVAAAALPGNSYMLAWNSQTNNDIWTMFYDGTTTTFQSPQVVPNAQSVKAPALAAQVTDGKDSGPWNQVVLAFTGLDEHVYMARQQYGTSTWTNPKWTEAWTRNSPSVALSGSGYGVITLTGYDFYVDSLLIKRNGEVSGLYDDATLFQWTDNSPLAVISGNSVYYVRNGGVSSGLWWKFVTDFGSWATPPAPQW